MSFPNRTDNLYTRIRSVPVMKITGPGLGPEIRQMQRALRRSEGPNESALLLFSTCRPYRRRHAEELPA